MQSVAHSEVTMTKMRTTHAAMRSHEDWPLETLRVRYSPRKRRMRASTCFRCFDHSRQLGVLHHLRRGNNTTENGYPRRFGVILVIKDCPPDEAPRAVGSDDNVCGENFT